MIDSRRCPSPTPGSTCRPTSSGPRWCCASFMRTRTSRLISRRPRVSTMPTRPHISLLRKSAQRTGTPRGRWRFGVGRVDMSELRIKPMIALDHALETEPCLGSLPACAAVAPRRHGVREIRNDGARQRIAVVCPHQAPGDLVLDEIPIRAHARGDDRQARRHGFENRTGDTFRERRQYEAVQAAERFSHVRSFAGKPCKVANPALLQDCFDVGFERAFANHDETYSLPRSGMLRERAHEGT